MPWAEECTSHAVRSSPTEAPVIRPSTRRITALRDNSTTVILSMAVHLISSGLDAIEIPIKNQVRPEAISQGLLSYQINIRVKSVSCEGLPLDSCSSSQDAQTTTS